MRLDQFLLQTGMVSSRERGRALIMEGLVYVNGDKADKAGAPTPEDARVELRGGPAYVSRGGRKLEKALKVFSAPPAGLVCMDVGASTGGFTDCMLQNGARKVYAVDVGYGQLAWKLRCDPRVVVIERCNIRNMLPGSIDEFIDYFTIDVSFISLKIVLPAIVSLAAKQCKVICLVKPQFEAGKGNVGKKGVVRDPDIHIETLHCVLNYAKDNRFNIAGLDYSPVKGPQGNIEYLLFLSGLAEKNVNTVDFTRLIEKTVRDSHIYL
jgi:23S rRNA (cytidine1920-2'-O)/16S rRNA (cytidine1409-2'-O)-methyltransferase